MKYPQGVLPEFDGLEVVAAAVRITKAGDGLSDALKLKPLALEIGEEVFYVLRGVVSQVNHKGDPGAGLTRVHTVVATGVTAIDRRNAERHLNKAAEELANAKQAATGSLSLINGGEEEG